MPDRVVPVHQETDIILAGFLDNRVKLHAADVGEVWGFPEDPVCIILAEQEEQAGGRTLFRIGCHFRCIVASGLPPLPAQLRYKMLLCLGAQVSCSSLSYPAFKIRVFPMKEVVQMFCGKFLRRGPEIKKEHQGHVVFVIRNGITGEPLDTFRK